jgi:predicted nucleotidyltransferase
MSQARQQTEQLLELLLDAGIQFAVVGGVAAIAHGGSIATRDLDIIAPMTQTNLRRLIACLGPHHPRHATRPDLGIISPDVELSSFRLLLLDTDLGRLDVLGNIEPVGSFDSFEVIEMPLLEGRTVGVISLDQLISIKAHLGRPKDRIVEQELRAIREVTTALD